MSATNLDLPVLVSAEQIRRREFVTIRRGYDPDQVRDYLEQLADQIGVMQSLLRDTRMKAEAAARANEERIDPYEELARRVSGVIREADESADKIRSGAREDAERVTREARADADRIRTDAQARAEEAREAAEASVHEARSAADRTIAGLATRREALVGQLASMQERLLAVARDLERTIEIGEPETDAPEIPGVSDASTMASATMASAVAPGESSQGAEEIIDVTGGDDRSDAIGDGGDATGSLFEALDDPSYEDLWGGAQALQLEVPDIPPLDLDWGDEEDDDLQD